MNIFSASNYHSAALVPNYLMEEQSSPGRGGGEEQVRVGGGVGGERGGGGGSNTCFRYHRSHSGKDCTVSITFYFCIFV